MVEYDDKKNGDSVGKFVLRVRRRLNWIGMLRCLLWATAIGGAIMLCVAIGHVWLGYRVPILAYAIVTGSFGLIALVAWLALRINDDRASHFADTHFGLKDSVRSCRNFSNAGLEGGFYSLQAAQTEDQIAQQSFASIRYRPSYRLVALAALLVIVSIGLGFKGHSKSVLDRLERENTTFGLTSDVNEELQKLIDELDRSIDDPEERKLLEPDKLRKWVDALEQTKDHREALRQYAKLERMINLAAEALQQRRDEQMLDLAADELKKESPTRELGDALKQKKYDKASEKLDELDPEKKVSEADGDTKIAEKRKELAKLKAAANRLADAARRSNGRPSQSGNQQQARDQQSANGKNSENKKPGNEAGSIGDSAQANDAMEGEPDDGELAQMLEDLEEAVNELDDAMEQAEFEETDEEAMGECEACQGRVQDELDKLGKKLMRMARQRSAQAKLKKLGAKCNGFQSSIAQSQSPEAGGKEAGQGSNESTRQDRDNPDVDGWKSALKGIKGEGPSLTKVESADDGTGVSGRTHQAKVREFQRQFESFVEREDVPEELKSGVKNYFTQIHESGKVADNTSETDAPANGEVDGESDDSDDPQDK